MIALILGGKYDVFLHNIGSLNQVDPQTLDTSHHFEGIPQFWRTPYTQETENEKYNLRSSD